MRSLPFSWLLLSLSIFLTGCGEPPKPSLSLYRAVHIGDLDQIKRHLFWGTDVNRPGPDGDYPLHVAVGQGRVAIAKELLQNGAERDARDAIGRTPLHLALSSGKVHAAKLLLDNGADEDLQALLFDLVREDTADRDTLHFLSQQGVDLNAQGPDGASPLHVAAASGDVKQAKRLIAAGADINLVDASGATPLSLAATLRDPATKEIMIELLAQYGAKR
ncbi:MAG: ankyrin repeat domain-containing protein [Thiohalocapsa sp.]